MEDKIQAYRQPMVTTTGIILGFMLNFVSSWVKLDSPLGDGLAYFVGICLLSGSIMLILVLFRILNMNYQRTKAEQYYYKTLVLLIVGISVAFLGVFVDMLTHFMMD